MNEIPQVQVTELDNDALMIDVRERDEWDAGHAPGSIHIPMGEISARLDELAELPHDQSIRVVCRSGGRSARTVAWLNHQGFEAVNVDGGMRAWDAAGKPMVSVADAAYVK